MTVTYGMIPRTKRAETIARIKRRNRRYVYDYQLAHPCVDCGEADPVVLEFDHVRGVKTAHISRLVRANASLERLQLEIDKCEVVCANCHRRRTAKRESHYADINGPIKIGPDKW